MMLEVRHLTVRVGAFEIRDFSLEVAAGECVALMGPSGCGKTTLVEAVCGVGEGEGSGTIRLDGRDVVRLPPGERGIGWVPQDVLLFPGMTVRGHLEFGLRARGWERGRIAHRVNELAKGLGLEGLLDRRPLGLSGGEERRVALGRVLAVRPVLLCLDEALTGLDEKTHGQVLAVVRTMVRKEGVAALHVTHSRAEAEAIADRVVEM